MPEFETMHDELLAHHDDCINKLGYEEGSAELRAEMKVIQKKWKRAIKASRKRQRQKFKWKHVCKVNASGFKAVKQIHLMEKVSDTEWKDAKDTNRSGKMPGEKKYRKYQTALEDYLLFARVIEEQHGLKYTIQSGKKIEDCSESEEDDDGEEGEEEEEEDEPPPDPPPPAGKKKATGGKPTAPKKGNQDKPKPSKGAQASAAAPAAASDAGGAGGKRKRTPVVRD